ncbi:MAG: ribbon-helix-helix protein, CopG family, partial [Aquincola sp.]|nr:ribbon-helix-helix protein, CopG family [Aquincola sp.]
MRAAAREFFTVDLRGLRAALTARAASQGVTESDVLRSALAAALGSDACGVTFEPTSQIDASPSGASIKLSVRLPRPDAHRLDHHARAAGLSRGAYLGRLIQGAPPVMASGDRSAG